MNRHTKDHQDFIRCFRTTDFPFKAIVEGDKDSRDMLFSEFLKTERKPDLELYILPFFTENEYKEVIEDANKKIPASSGTANVSAHLVPWTDGERRLKRIIENFKNRLYKKTLKAAFYSFDIKETDTVKTLIEIGKEFDSLQNIAIKNQDVSQFDNYAEKVADSIQRLLSGLKNQLLANEVCSKITAEGEHIIIDIALWSDNGNKTYAENYRHLKRHFNFHLQKSLPAPAAVSIPPTDAAAEAEPVTSAASELDSKIRPYGFFDLPKVAELNLENQQKLVRLICKNNLPYKIAMLDELDFFKHLKEEYSTRFKTKKSLYIEVSKCINSPEDGRDVAGNFRTLQETSMENRERFTAHNFKRQVKEDHEGLK